MNFYFSLDGRALDLWVGVMARPLRIEMPDGLYHLTSRGLERRAIVRDDDDRKRCTELGCVGGRSWISTFCLTDGKYQQR